MEIPVLLFVTILPVAFLVWTLRFKTEFALLAIAPLSMLLLITLSINADPVLELTVNECFDVVYNSSATTAGNVTNATNGVDLLCRDNMQSYPIGPAFMQILNVSMLAFVLITMGLVIRRAILAIQESRQKDED